MNQYFKEIDAFVKAHLNLVKVVGTVTAEDSEKLLFDIWNLKQLILHITNWNAIIYENIMAVKSGKTPDHYGSVQKINENAVLKSESLLWDQALKDFRDSGVKLATEYISLPAELFQKKIWDGKSTTPLKLLTIVTNHYLKEHTPEIVKKLSSFKLLLPNYDELLKTAIRDSYNIGVCAAVLNSDKEVLLVRRSQSDQFSGIWEMPGGSVENGESLKVAVQREILEEVGINVDVDLEIFDYFEFYNVETGKYKRKFCLKCVVDSYINIKLSPDHDEYRWYRLDELKRSLVPQSKDSYNYNVWDDHYEIAVKALGSN